jgi:hypothetical protein
VFRLKYAICRRAGLFERTTPTGSWPRKASETHSKIFVVPENIGSRCVDEANDISKGIFRLFSFHRVNAGFPPNWHRNQISGEYAESDAHWSKISAFKFGDIKAVWELSRFSWAFTLARAYAKTGEERYAEVFWTLFSDWMVFNPPNKGANWMCGQEASLRLIAVTFAMDVMSVARASTAQRKDAFASFVVVTGRRIAGNIDYALSQSNNHGISEAVGLVTAALLAKKYAQAENWYRRGVEALSKQLAGLVYADGAFAQHSATYHRVLIHDLLWYSVVMRAFNQPIPEKVFHPAKKSVAFIASLMTIETGRVPLYGASDGANVLPLADEEYGDFRSLVQAGYAVFCGGRPLKPGLWDELADWMVGSVVKHKNLTKGLGKPENTSSNGWVHHRDGGCLIWRYRDLRVFFRCPTSFQHRPSQADLLHVDIEWKGTPIAIDAGTYSYNSDNQFTPDLKDAAVHNTVTFDGKEPIEKIGRFLYLPWPNGQCYWEETNRFIAEHDGWKKFGYRHIRKIESTENGGFIIIDKLTTLGLAVAKVNWLIPDLPYRLDNGGSSLILDTPLGGVAIEWDYPDVVFELVRCDAQSNRGWYAPNYYHRKPALSLILKFQISGSIQGWTRFTPVTTPT